MRIICHCKVYSPSPTAETLYPDWLLLSWLPCTKCGQSHLFSIYPFIPWMTPVLWGLLYGRLFTIYKSTTSRIVLHLAAFIGCTVLFLGLRFANGFGNIHDELISSPLESFISFFNLTKYPPSLTYLAWTLGVNHLLLAIFLCFTLGKLNVLLVFGNCALFFYVMHFYMYALFKLFLSFTYPKPLTFWPFMLVWIIGLVALYPLCQRYMLFKSKQGPDSLWRFF